MKESSESQKWKSEELREQRKARLAEMKSKDGGKKPVKTGNRVATVITIIVLVLALVGAGVWGAFRLGLPHQYLNALSVGNEKLNVVEFNYYYHNIASQFQLDPNDEVSAQTLKSDSGIEGFATVEDYLKDVAAQQAQMNVMLADKAKTEGIALDAEDQQIIDDFFTQIDTSAKQAEMSSNALLSAQYGVGATRDSLKPVLERYLLAQKYSVDKQESFEFSDEDIEKYYQENKDNFDRITYRIFTIAADYESDADEETKKAAMQTAKEKASEMLSEVEDEDSFQAACLEYAKDDDERARYEVSDRSKMFLRLMSSVSGTEASEWLFDETRTNGDKTLIETSTGYQVIMYLDRSESDFPYVDVNHILIKADRATAEPADIEAAKSKAENILKQYQDGEQTLAAFEALAKENSEDTSAATGGLIADIYPGQTEAEFEQWAFADGRKSGDTGIVQTSYGFHVMYFNKADGKTDRQIRIDDVLRTEAYQSYVNEEIKNYAYSIDSFGYKLTT